MIKGSANLIGIIAEDESDVNSAKVLIKRIANNDHIGIRKFIGKGCGNIRKKCNAWANQLMLKGCSILILIHDLDTKDLNNLSGELSSALSPCPINKYMICIPVKEFEAWFLSDPEAIQRAMNLKKTPRIVGIPEQINSPKEYLGSIVFKTSQKEKIYINTRHNEKIARVLSVQKVKARCNSFALFYNFVINNV